MTPRATVTSGSLAGAEMMTFLAPASRCLAASARAVKKPVDSITTSTPRSPQGSAAGSRSESTFSGVPPTEIVSPLELDLGREAAEDRVVLEQVGERARVGEVVDGDELDVRSRRVRGAEDVAPDASETVDADLHSHEVMPPEFVLVEPILGSRPSRTRW